MDKKPYGTVLIKAAKIIDVISNSSEHLSLQDISIKTGLTSSTTLKILDTLVLIGYVNKDDKHKNFSLGEKLIGLSNFYVESLDIVKLSEQPLKELLHQVNETVHLGTLQNNEIMYVKKLEPANQTIYLTSKVGICRPLYSSAMGKAVLSEFDEDDLKAYLETTDLFPFTKHTITDKNKLRSEIVKVQRDKIAYDDEEMEEDCFCVGTSIIRDNKIIGAFSVSIPKYRLNKEKKKEIITSIQACKQKIENNFI